MSSMCEVRWTLSQDGTDLPATPVPAELSEVSSGWDAKSDVAATRASLSESAR